MQIYISKNGNQQGPYSVNDLNDLLESETIAGDDLCWYEGCADWIPLSQFPGFAPPKTSAPPPPPTIHPTTTATQSKHKTVKEAYGSWKGLGLFDLIPGIRALPYPVRFILMAAFVVFIVIFGVPFVTAPGLPAVDAPEVVDLAQRAISESPAVKLTGELVGPITISNPGEVSYDKSRQKRVARAELKTKLGTEVIYYTVEWHNRSKGIIWVQIQDHP